MHCQSWITSLVVSAFVLLLASLASAGTERRDTSAAATEVVAAGPVETVFSWQRDACDRADVPDAPARAFRDAAENVHLYAANHHNRGLVGRDLHSVRPAGCSGAFHGAEMADPAAYDDRAWLTSFWAEDGQTVYALVHNEYLGNKHDRCRSSRSIDCWMNTIVLAVSNDGGLTFRRASPGSAALVAALPYRYDPSEIGHWGLFSPSNIVEKDGFLYTFVHSTTYRDQPAAECLMRTRDIADPRSWRAWDGEGFTRTFVDPYAGAVDPSRHICAPVGKGKLRWPVGAIVRHEPSGRYIAVMAASGRPGSGSASGIYAASSPDLIDWSEPKLILKAQVKQSFACNAPEPGGHPDLVGYAVAYPSIIDPSSRSRNFDTIGDRAELHLVRYAPEACKIETLKRDLVRMPLRMRGGE
jgi:hypothetical protein